MTHFTDAEIEAAWQEFNKYGWHNNTRDACIPALSALRPSAPGGGEGARIERLLRLGDAMADELKVVLVDDHTLFAVLHAYTTPLLSTVIGTEPQRRRSQNISAVVDGSCSSIAHAQFLHDPTLPLLPFGTSGFHEL